MPNSFSSLESEELVAYLDGELDDAACERVEQRLAGDAAYRGELQRLQRAWDCLDRLPETAVDESFTRSTIEMVTLAASRELTELEQTLPRRRTAFFGLGGVLLLAALAAGFVATLLIWPDPNQQLLRDLPVVEHLDLYQAVESYEALRAIADAQLFTDETSPEPLAPPLPSRADDSLWGRRAWVKSLASTEQATLQNNLQRFLALSPNEQDRLRRFEEKIAASPQRDALLQTLTAYQAWQAELSPGQRADLAALDADQRLAEIAKQLKKQQAERTRTLAPDDSKALFAWLGEKALTQRDRILFGVPEQFRSHFAQQPPEHQKSALVWMAYRKSRFAPHTPLAALSAAETDDLVARLSPAAQAAYAQAGDAEAQKRLLLAWIQSTLSQNHFWSRAFGDNSWPSQGELEKFFEEKLTSDQRAELLRTPSDEMQRELRRLYLQNTMPPGLRSLPHGDGPRRHFRDGDRTRGEEARPKKPS